MATYPRMRHLIVGEIKARNDIGDEPGVIALCCLGCKSYFDPASMDKVLAGLNLVRECAITRGVKQAVESLIITIQDQQENYSETGSTCRVWETSEHSPSTDQVHCIGV